MKRIALIGTIIAVLAMTATIVVAQDSGGDGHERMGEGDRPPGPGPIPGDHPGPGGPPDLLAPDVNVEAMERVYAEELRLAHEQIAGMRTRLEEIHVRLREIWGMRDQEMTAEETEKLREEFRDLVEESTKIELQIAEHQVELAQKGMDLALERLVQAQVALREARIKQMRRQNWMRGEHGGRFRDLRERHREGGPPPEDETKHDEQPSGSGH